MEPNRNWPEDISNPPPSFRVGPVSTTQVKEAADFMARVMAEVYPILTPGAIASKVQSMDEVYLKQADANLLAVLDGPGRIVATAATKRWDDRIRAVRGQWSSNITAELEKVYVHKELRREGLGNLLVGGAEELCRSHGYDRICLHTHRFLPGACDFWLARGYRVVAESDNDWQTVFMEKTLVAANDGGVFDRGGRWDIV